MSALGMANALLSNMAAAQSEHIPVTHYKFGEETGRRLKAAGCSCGWHAHVWYSGDEFVAESFARHMKAVIGGSTVPSMLAPEARE